MTLIGREQRELLCGTVAVLAIIAAVSGSAAWAQDSGSSNSNAQSDGNVFEFEEITVQARKRDEAIEDVPASVTAISDEDAERLALQDIADYIRQTPGAILVSSGPDYLNDITLRGQGGGRIGFSESTTGIYRNGVYVAGGGFGGRSYSKLDFFDMQSMEVYRGPQGALYGRNAVGGAVNIRVRQPDLEDASLRTSFEYASTDRYEVQAVANIPLSDNAAIRAGGYYLDQNEGFHKIAGTDDYADRETQYGGRFALAVDFDDVSRAVLTVEGSHSDKGGFTSTGQNIALDSDPYVREGTDTDDRVIIDQILVFGEYVREFSSSEFTLIANYENRDAQREFADFDHFLGINNPAVSLIDAQGEDFWRAGFEARLASTNSGPTSWLVGVDYLSLESDISAFRGGSLSGRFANSRGLARQFREDDPTDKLTSYSLFGLYSFDLSDRLNVSVEARIQVDEKDFTFVRIDNNPLTDEAIPFTQFEEKWTRFLPTVSFNYEVSDDTRLYARFATGYRPGGFNPSPAPGFFDQTAYDPEDVRSGEVGLKGDYRWGDTVVRPQISFFYTETKDVQQTSSISPTNPTFSLQNVGSSNLYGGEFELLTITKIGDGTWRNTVGLSTAYGKFGDGTDILFRGEVQDLSDARVPRTRDYIINFNSMYRTPITSEVTGMVSVNLQAEGGGFDNANNSRASEDYVLLDVSLSLMWDKWRLTAYGKNITDERYRLVLVNNNAYHNNPSLYGVKLSMEW